MKISKITSCTCLFILLTSCNSSPKNDSNKESNDSLQNNDIESIFSITNPNDFILDDFEKGNYWYAVGNLWNDWNFYTDSVSVELSEKWRTNGKKSLLCTTLPVSEINTIPAVFACDSPLITDFSKYSILSFDVNNFQNKELEIAVAFQSGSSWKWNQTSSKKIKEPTKIIFDLSEIDKTELQDVKRLLILITNKNIDGSFYIDNLILSQ